MFLSAHRLIRFLYRLIGPFDFLIGSSEILISLSKDQTGDTLVRPKGPRIVGPDGKQPLPLSGSSVPRRPQRNGMDQLVLPTLWTNTCHTWIHRSQVPTKPNGRTPPHTEADPPADIAVPHLPRAFHDIEFTCEEFRGYASCFASVADIVCAPLRA